MGKLIPFRTRRQLQTSAHSLLALSATCARARRLPPCEPERLGNLLQRLVLQEPEVVLEIEDLVVEILAQLDDRKGDL